MTYVPTTCDGVLTSCPTYHVATLSCTSDFAYLSNRNIVVVYCHSLAFGIRYIPVLSARLLLLLLLSLYRSHRPQLQNRLSHRHPSTIYPHFTVHRPYIHEIGLCFSP
jgi:hypothetical protein